MKILLADDHPMVRDGMKSVLRKLDDHVTILDAQSAVHEPLTQEESACAIAVHTHPAPDLDDLLRRFED